VGDVGADTSCRTVLPAEGTGTEGGVTGRRVSTYGGRAEGTAAAAMSKERAGHRRDAVRGRWRWLQRGREQGSGGGGGYGEHASEVRAIGGGSLVRRGVWGWG
jgi:hypothetical protein